MSLATARTQPRQARIQVEPGRERTVVATVLRERLDQAYLAGAGPRMRDALERAGLPFRALASRLWWQPPTGPATWQSVAWSSDPGGWHHDASATATPRDVRVYAAIHGRTVFARDLVTDTVEATAVPLDDTIADECAAVAATFGCPVAVPVDQAALAARLAARQFMPGGAEDHCVVDAGLSMSLVPVVHRPFRVSRGDVADFGRRTGDLNPLHFDDTFARAAGFEGRIAHGMLFDAWLTRFLGMEYPGPGTVFVNSRMGFFAPVYPDRDYVARVSVPWQDSSRGLQRVVAQLTDGDGRHCTLAYNLVLRRVGK